MHGQKAGPPSAEELEQMRALVKEAMEQGALGVASSLSGPPGSWIDTDTLVAMCEVASRYGGIYSTHMRTEGRGVFESVAEAIEIGRRANVPVDIIHLKIAEHEMWGQMPELTASIAAARARGQDVQANVYPYRAGQNNLSSIIPPWAHEGRLAGDDRAAARTLRCGSGWKTKSTTESPAPTGITTTRPPAAGTACCWFRSRIRSTSSSKASA